MIKVGITGGIGSGKSLVCKVLCTMGIPIFYADDQTKQLYENNTQVRQAIINTFGSEAYTGTTLNRAYLAHIVFDSPEQMARLTAIAYPALHKQFAHWASMHAAAPYVVEEAAMLIESQAYRYMDVIINVTADTATRIARVMEREHCTEQAVLQRMSRQMSDEERNKIAHFVIHNDNNQALLPQIMNIHTRLLAW